MSRSAQPKNFQEFSRRFILFLVLVLLLLAFGTGAFMLLQGTSTHQSLLHTLETLAFGFEKSDSITINFLQIFLTLFGVFVIWWILWGLFDMLFTQEFVDFINYKKTKLLMKTLKDHTIIIGGGITGMHAGQILKQNKKPYIILENSIEQIRELRKEKLLCALVDVGDKNMYKKVGILKAKQVLITVPNDEKTIMIALILKSLNPAIAISARLNNPDNASLFQEIGISKVVNPQMVTAHSLLDD